MSKRGKVARIKELTLRLSAEERRAVEGAASADHLPASTWARQAVLRRVDESREERARREERRRAGRELAAMLKNLPDDGAHADELERSRREDWEAVKRTLLDTSFFIAVERRNLQALERFCELLEAGDGATVISAVTLTELLASPTLSTQRRTFYEKLRGCFDVLPVTERAAIAGIAAARRVGGAKPPDVMIAGVALEHRLRVLTSDADFARLLGDSAELLRAS